MLESIKILVIDTSTETINSLKNVLCEEPYRIETAQNTEEGLQKIRAVLPDLILLNISLPNINAHELMKQINIIDKTAIRLLLIENEKDISKAIEFINSGSYDYILKPLPFERLKIIITKAIEKKELSNEVELLKSRLEKKFSFTRIVGNSVPIREVFSMIKKVAAHNISILITGESGTGKELIARVIHHESTRFGRSFIPIDCSTLPETLVESEIFGYEKGSFTGADKMNIGKIEMAQGGTLFLDEIGNLPVKIQIKLLRLLQEKEIERIGGRKLIKIDARIVAATNINLQKGIEDGKFREDLFYRLNEFSLHIPPLRERKEDIPLLAKHFLNEFNFEFNKDIKNISLQAQEIFLNYNWPGNIRELKNVIKRAVLLAEETIDIQHFPMDMISRKNSNKTGIPSSLKEISRAHIEEMEKSLIISKLNEVHWNKRKAAALLKIDYKTLFNKINKYNITL